MIAPRRHGVYGEKKQKTFSIRKPGIQEKLKLDREATP
jgi:hypothetical protein